MINWMYEHIQTSEEYSQEQKNIYNRVLGETLLEFIWDESLRPNEQLQLILSGNPTAKGAAKEQIIRNGDIEAFRFVDPITGIIKYICGSVPCSSAVAKEFDKDAGDPLNSLKANTANTGQIYGFLVPKAKERRLVFKTSSAPPPGGKPEKGGECAIISTISYHIQMLKDISNLLVTEGYPRFILVENVLDEKARVKREKKEAEAAGIKGFVATLKPENRRFENAVRACALKNIIFRFITIMNAAKDGRRYFYRPIAALKSGHKGTVMKA
jgi:hypothetical protein